MTQKERRRYVCKVREKGGRLGVVLVGDEYDQAPPFLYEEADYNTSVCMCASVVHNGVRRAEIHSYCRPCTLRFSRTAGLHTLRFSRTAHAEILAYCEAHTGVQAVLEQGSAGGQVSRDLHPPRIQNRVTPPQKTEIKFEKPIQSRDFHMK
eukprot:2673429-Rhodomonas_salina.1